MPYVVKVANSAAKAIKAFPDDLRQRVLLKIKEILEDPFTTAEGHFRQGGNLKARVGQHRILYDVDVERQVVSICAVAPRNEVYSKKHKSK